VQTVEREKTRDNGHEVASPDGAQRRSQTERDVGVRDEASNWRDQAIRLQADMDNYRKRQRRLARDEVNAERRRLYDSFFLIIDNLERALAASPEGDGSLREGVALTYRTAVQLLSKEGVEPIDTTGHPFDPAWHEAVATQDRGPAGAAPGYVVDVVQTGYRMGDELLRPARVIVAV
jgi:molecular chaperone GrpE